MCLCICKLICTRLKAEKSDWDNLLTAVSSSSKEHSLTEEHDSSVIPMIDQVESKVLDQQEQQSILSDMHSHQGVIDASRTRLKAATQSLEFKIDSLADGVHKMEKFKQSGDSVVDKILQEASGLLQQRDEAASTSAGTGKVGIGDLLRSLSRAT